MKRDKQERCQICGRIVSDLIYTTIMGRPYYVCHECYDKQQPLDIRIERKWTPFYPELAFRHSPLAVMIAKIHTRDALLPLGISVKRTEEKVSEEEGEASPREEIDWEVLVGAEPIDDLKRKGIPYVLAAKFAEDNAVITARELARYLAEMANHPELEPYLEKFKEEREDLAREILNELANMGIVKKESRKGERGANIYDYLGGDRSWRKEGF